MLDIESQLDNCMPSSLDYAQELVDGMRYSVLGGGKRLRGQLVCATTHALIGDFTPALPSACAIECMHAYSLVHDDLPVMDNAEWRRGKPSCHAVFGEAIATLVGDALQPLAFSLILEAETFSERQRLSLCQELAHAIGWRGMVGGQAWDISLTNGPAMTIEQLERLHQAKTGAVFSAAVSMGRISSGLLESDDLEVRLERFARNLGLAFQVVDDVIDCSQPPEVTGKPSGQDVSQGKQTYPALIGLEGSKQLANDLLENAVQELRSVDLEDSLLAHVARNCVERIK